RGGIPQPAASGITILTWGRPPSAVPRSEAPLMRCLESKVSPAPKGRQTCSHAHSLGAPLDHSVRSCRYFEPSLSATRTRLFRLFWSNPLRRFKAVDRLQIISREHQGGQRACWRAILPSHFNHVRLV